MMLAFNETLSLRQEIDTAIKNDKAINQYNSEIAKTYSVSSPKIVFTDNEVTFIYDDEVNEYVENIRKLIAFRMDQITSSIKRWHIGN